MCCRSPIKIMCTTRLNVGIFRVHRFSVVTPTRPNKSDFIFDSTYTAVHLTTYLGIYSLHMEQFLALYALMGFFGYVGTTDVLSASVSDFMIWDGGLPFSGIS
jgi:hypothetical protein